MNLKCKHKYIIKSPKGRGFIFIDDKIQREKIENTIREMNLNSYLGYNLLSPYSNEIIKNIKKENRKYIDNYMSNDYHGNGIMWIFSGYPHDESPSYLTEISFTSNNYNIFGFKPGDNIINLIELLKKQKFRKIANRADNSTETIYKKNDLYIILYHDDETIIKIIVRVRTFYLGNNLY